jgi:nickel transport protein
MMNGSKEFNVLNATGFTLRAVALAAVFMLAAVGPALAHKFIATGWVEGDSVALEAAFGNGDLAQNAEVIVFDDTGNQLLATTTDDNGECYFTIPKKSALSIKLNAGMGHQATVLIPLEDVAAAFPDDNAPAAASAPQPAATADAEPAAGQIAQGLSSQEIQVVVEKALDKKLRPIIRKLSEKEPSGQDPRNIAAGIGYIFGLVGIGAYFNNRRKKS